MPGNKVLIFYTENEGKKNESLSFKTIDLDGDGETEWSIYYLSLISLSTQPSIKLQGQRDVSEEVLRAS